MRIAFAALVLLLSTSTPALAADPTSALIAQLETCDVRTAVQTGPRLDLLLALADGRSGREFGNLIQGPRACTGHVFAFGEGDDELVFVGAARPSEPNVGAILWVDHGWWRAATAPIGYLPYPAAQLRRGSARELFIDIDSGGSAGAIGLVGLRLEGSRETTFWRLDPELHMEIGRFRPLDDDRFLLEGRDDRDRLFTWYAHAGWPGGAQRIFERRGDTLVLAASRQTHDPYWVLTGFIGALFDGDAATMGRFATPTAVQEGLDLPRPRRGPYGLSPIDYDTFLSFQAIASAEQANWDALPSAMRRTAESGPFRAVLGLRLEGWTATEPLLATFIRDGDGWTLAHLVPLTQLANGDELTH